MKALFAGIVLLISAHVAGENTFKGNVWAFATNNAGGYIVLTDQPCQSPAGVGATAYTFTSERIEAGCAFIEEENKVFKIYWEALKGEQEPRSYPFNQFEAASVPKKDFTSNERSKLS